MTIFICITNETYLWWWFSLFRHLFHSQVKVTKPVNSQPTKNVSLLVNVRMDWRLCKFILVSSRYIFSLFLNSSLNLDGLEPVFPFATISRIFIKSSDHELLHKELRYIHFVFPTDLKGAIMETRTPCPYFCLLPYYFGSIF